MGVFRGAGQATSLYLGNALESEFQSLLYAIQNAWTRGFRKVIFEGDNKILYQILTKSRASFAMFNWLKEVQSWIPYFDEIQFVWTSRKTNTPADILAKSIRVHSVSPISMNCIPQCTSSALHAITFLRLINKVY